MSVAAIQCAVRRTPRVAIVVLVLALAGCHRDHYQSALHPRGPAAADIAELWWVMFVVYGGVFLVTMLLVGLAILRRRNPSSASPLGNRFIIASGIVIPTIIVTVMLIYTVVVTARLRPPDAEFTIRVTGHMWWWEVEYIDHDITVANEIHIPVGEAVRFELTAADVVHSFWVPNLHGKMDNVPGHMNVFWLQADEPGVYRGQCAEYCGLQHAWMAFKVVALPREEFDAWLAARSQTPPPPDDPTLLRGREVFVEGGCANCHAIRGVSDARLGPDLTHLGSRLTIGAGLLPNNRGTLSGWIANPQPLKPGNLMPATHLPPDDLHALVDYLLSLE